MSNIRISEVCGLCAGCKYAINTAVKEISSGKMVTIFKEIVHNKNVNSYLESIGAKCENDIEKLTDGQTIIIRAHGEPPETYAYFEQKGFDYKDCTCRNVKAIHNLVKEYSEKGYKIIIIGKHQKVVHPEVLGTIGWAKNDAILVETHEDIERLQSLKNEKVYVVCQTTFNSTKAEKLIKEIEQLLKINFCEVIVNKSLCQAQKIINDFSANLARDCDIMIVVGGANSSNSLELYNNVNSICPSIFIEDINTYKDALKVKNLILKPSTKVGITAGASTRKEELDELKDLIEKDLKLFNKKVI